MAGGRATRASRRGTGTVSADTRGADTPTSKNPKETIPEVVAALMKDIVKAVQDTDSFDVEDPLHVQEELKVFLAANVGKETANRTIKTTEIYSTLHKRFARFPYLVMNEIIVFVLDPGAGPTARLNALMLLDRILVEVHNNIVHQSIIDLTTAKPALEQASATSQGLEATTDAGIDVSDPLGPVQQQWKSLNTTAMEILAKLDPNLLAAHNGDDGGTKRSAEDVEGQRVGVDSGSLPTGVEDKSTGTNLTASHSMDISEGAMTNGLSGDNGYDLSSYDFFTSIEESERRSSTHAFVSIYGSFLRGGPNFLAGLISCVLGIIPTKSLIKDSFNININKRRAIKMLRSWKNQCLFFGDTERIVNETYALIVKAYNDTIEMNDALFKEKRKTDTTPRLPSDVLTAESIKLEDSTKLQETLEIIKQRMDCDRDGLKREREERILLTDNWNRDTDLTEFDVEWDHQLDIIIQNERIKRTKKLDDNNVDNKDRSKDDEAVNRPEVIGRDMWIKMAVGMIKHGRSTEHNKKIMKEFKPSSQQQQQQQKQQNSSNDNPNSSNSSARYRGASGGRSTGGSNDSRHRNRR